MSRVRRALWVIALALVAAVLIGNAVMSYRSTVTLSAGDAESVRSRDVSYAIDDLLSTVIDAETGQRGYLLSQKRNISRHIKPRRTPLPANWSI